MNTVTKRRVGATLAAIALTAGGLGVAGCGGDSASTSSATAAATTGTAADKDALLTSLLASEGAATVKGTGDVNGTPVVFVEVKNSDGNATLAIQTVGEPYPVQLTNGKSKGAITFSDWNAPVSVTAPAGAVRPDELTGKGGASG